MVDLESVDGTPERQKDRRGPAEQTLGDIGAAADELGYRVLSMDRKRVELVRQPSGNIFVTIEDHWSVSGDTLRTVLRPRDGSNA